MSFRIKQPGNRTLRFYHAGLVIQDRCISGQSFHTEWSRKVCITVCKLGRTNDARLDNTQWGTLCDRHAQVESMCNFLLAWL